MNLQLQSFLALAAIAWADGSVDRIETAGLLRAAEESGHEGNSLAAIEATTKQKVLLDDVDVTGLSPWDQVLTYALASWLAQLDGVVTTEEHATLQALGDKLGLSQLQRKKAAAAAFDIACQPESGRPERYDFQKLSARLREKLPSILEGS